MPPGEEAKAYSGIEMVLTLLLAIPGAAAPPAVEAAEGDVNRESSSEFPPANPFCCCCCCCAAAAAALRFLLGL